MAQLVILFLTVISFDLFSQSTATECQRYDGWYNNLANPNWGSVGSNLYRKAKSNYSDGVYMIDEYRPSARDVSDLVFTGPAGIPHANNLTTMAAFFSQVIAYEIMHTTEISCPLEMLKVKISQCDPIFDKDCMGDVVMPFFRSKYDKATGTAFNAPREQVNEATSWIDGSFIYSTMEPWVHMMRSFRNGTLKESQTMVGYPPFNSDRLPLDNPAPPQIHKVMNPERLFELGDPRSNENPGLLSFALLFHRWHNYLARTIQIKNPTFTDFQVFDRARQWVIATLQHVTYNEFLPAYLNRKMTQYGGYDPDLPPGITHLFAVGAFRSPHTLIPAGLLLRDTQCNYQKSDGSYKLVRLCNTWWNSQEVINEYALEQVLLGMSSQISEAQDAVMIEDLRNFVFGPMHFSRRDLCALTLMRGRDHGLPDYNSVRVRYGLEPRTWQTINPQDYKSRPEFYDELAGLYGGKIAALDFYIGGILEPSWEVFGAVLVDQFDRIRSADRFWFENKANNLFSDDEINEIRQITLKDIIVKTTQISSDDIQDEVFFWRSGDPCPQPFQVMPNASYIDKCTPFQRYDYFSGNDISFIASCIGLSIVPLVCIIIACVLLHLRRRPDSSTDLIREEFRQLKLDDNNLDTNDGVCSAVGSSESGLGEVNDQKMEPWTCLATEWLNPNFVRQVRVVVGPDPAIVILKRGSGSLLRRIKFGYGCAAVNTSLPEENKSKPYALLMSSIDYDLVLRFDNYHALDIFLEHFKQCLSLSNRQIRINQVSTQAIFECAETAEIRQRKLEHFFREAYAEAFREPRLRNEQENEEYRLRHIDKSVLDTHLSKAEFADAIGMKENDDFVRRMFSCVARKDPDRISFQEFLNTISVFANGSLEQKLRIVYEMCDRHGNGQVDRQEFCDLLNSIGSVAGVNVDRKISDSVLHAAGIPSHLEKLNFNHFEAILTGVRGANAKMGLHLSGRRQYLTDTTKEDRESVSSFVPVLPVEPEHSWLRSKWNKMASYLEDYRQHIICLVLFYFFCAAFFFERFWHYSEMSEHRDLRRVMGVGIAVTRGAAAGISFCYSLMLLTVCKSVITKLRETWVNQFIPFDYAIQFHKMVGLVGLLFSVIHTVGHVINFYHISTQSTEGLRCLFSGAVFSSDFQPGMLYWLFGTVTGITGVLLVAVLSIMYVFAAPSIIHNCYHAFRLTHLLHILLYILTVVHGLPKLLDKPRFWCFLLGPAIVFIIDRMMQLKQSYRKLEVLTASLLPSDVTYVQFKRPRNFYFRSGQWVRISCMAFNSKLNEWHAFSLASAPQDPTLEIYVKAQGPWTWKLRRMVYEAQQSGLPCPVLHMTGPYGGGNQDWYNRQVCVMVGGGIGVTPYGSILLDLVKAKSGPNFSDVACKKVYFLWICPSHKSYEWFIDILRQVEEMDVHSVLETHICITQMFNKLDLRTTMMYICERHFQNIQGKSLFTGLKAVTHFGRPNLEDFLSNVQRVHKEQTNIGVFTCGPGTLNRSVRVACEAVNKNRGGAHFTHRYETF